MHKAFYQQLARTVKKDTRFVRKVAHHPFEFFHDIARDVNNNRPFRLPYLGAFHVKLSWKKGMVYSQESGYPEIGRPIYARIKMKQLYKEKMGVYLQHGKRTEEGFVSDDGTVREPLEHILYWVYSESIIE